MKNTTRRALLVTACSLPLALRSGLALAAMDTARASSFVQTTGNELIGVINANAPVAQRRERVAAILRRAVDIEGVGRFTLGRFNTDEDVEYVTELVVKQIKRLREMSPLYEMVQEGIDLASVEWAAH